jgi:hypothetical protein
LVTAVSGSGWITSIPGAPDVTMECLPGRMLPDDLRKFGTCREKR